MMHLILAVEGRKFLFGLLLLDAVVYYVVGMTSLWALLPLTVIVWFWFLENRPVLKSAPLSLLAPATGFITGIQRAHDPWLDRDGQRVDIRLSTSNSLYSTTEGKLQESWAKTINGTYHYVTWIQTDEQDDIVVAISSRLPLKNQLCFYPRTGDRVGQGDKTGFLYLPGCISIYVPPSATCLVEVGQNLIAGTPVAELARSSSHVTRSILKPAEEQ